MFVTCGGKMKKSLVLLNALTLRLCLSIICELKTLSYTGGSGVSPLVVALSVFVSIMSFAFFLSIARQPLRLHTPKLRT